MARPGLARTAAVLGLILCPIALAAQQRVGVRPSLRAGEMTHVTTHQEIVMRVGVKPGEPGPDYLHFNYSATYTQTNGIAGADGKLDAKIVLEEFRVEEAFADQPRPGMDTSRYKGRILLVTFDRDGKLLGIKVPPDMADVSSRLTQLLAGAYGMMNFLPPVQLAVGEETKHTIELPMRLPGSAAQGPLSAKTTLKLRALDKQRAARIARLQQDIDVDTATTTMQVTGGGTLDVNLDRGFVSGADVEWKLQGTVQLQPSQPAPPFWATIKIGVLAE